VRISLLSKQSGRRSSLIGNGDSCRSAFPILHGGKDQQSNSAREVLGKRSARVTIVTKLNELNSPKGL